MDDIAKLQAEIDDLKGWVIAFGAPWAVSYAHQYQLPGNALHPDHYDILARCGARMDSFSRGVRP